MGRRPDPWDRWETRILARDFASSDFLREYLQQESRVRTESIDEICEWLLGCAYQSYPPGQDTWPPRPDFESRRRGDCKDHSLWAWRKFNELGLPAQLMKGQCRSELDQPFESVPVWWRRGPWAIEDAHVWVQFHHENVEYLLESTVKDPAYMVRPVTDLLAHYRPWWAVSADLRRYAYSGLFYYFLGGSK